MFTPELKEECGIFAVTNNKKACFYTALGLYSLQHRGQEAAGIATYGLNRSKGKGQKALLVKFLNSVIKKLSLPEKKLSDTLDILQQAAAGRKIFSLFGQILILAE